MPLHIDAYLPEKTPGCCTAKVYALLFSQDHQALKDPGGGHILLPYTKAAHATFALVMTEHIERSKYYAFDLDDADFTLPANAFGVPYYLEIWERTLASLAYNRDQDTLRETRPFLWSGTRAVQAQLDPVQEDRLANYQAHVSMSYDSEFQNIRLIAFLDRNGELITDPQSCNAAWTDRAGMPVFNTTIVTFIPGFPGLFTWDQPGIDLDPDEVFALTVTILDANNVPHVTVTNPITWD